MNLSHFEKALKFLIQIMSFENEKIPNLQSIKIKYS